MTAALSDQIDKWMMLHDEAQEHVKLLQAALSKTVSQRDVLLEALQRIEDGQVMSGQFSHAETVLRYQEIARAAINHMNDHFPDAKKMIEGGAA